MQNPNTRHAVLKNVIIHYTPDDEQQLEDLLKNIPNDLHYQTEILNILVQNKPELRIFAIY